MPGRGNPLPSTLSRPDAALHNAALRQQFPKLLIVRRRLIHSFQPGFQLVVHGIISFFVTFTGYRLHQFRAYPLCTNLVQFLHESFIVIHINAGCSFSGGCVFRGRCFSGGGGLCAHIIQLELVVIFL